MTDNAKTNDAETNACTNPHANMSATPNTNFAEGKFIPEVAFTPSAFAKDHAAALAIFVFAVLFLGAMLRVLGLQAQSIAICLAFLTLCAMLAAVIEYVRRAKTYRLINENLQSADAASQFVSFTEEPGFLDGKMLFQTAERISVLANHELVEEKEQARKQREYTELWVHEIKTPIAAAKLILTNSHDTQSSNLKREIERIEQQVEQALYAARSTTLANDYVIRETNLANAIQQSCKKNARYLIEKGIRLDLSVAPDISVLTDESWLVFILGQIVSNSAKYGARSIAFSAKVHHANTVHGYTQLDIKDDGMGIPAADVPRVFERGFTGSVGRSSGSATGMGLYLVAEMCQRMGLGVQLTSEEGAGTCVSLRFGHNRNR